MARTTPEEKVPPPEALKSLADIVLPTDGILFPAWNSEASLVLLDGFQIRNPVQSVSTFTYEKCGYSTQRMYELRNKQLCQTVKEKAHLRTPRALHEDVTFEIVSIREGVFCQPFFDRR